MTQPYYAAPAAPPPPAGPGPAPLAQRTQTLATLCLVFGLLEIVYCLFRLVGQVVNGALIDAERSFLPSTPHGPSMGPMLDASKAFAQRIAPWEILRTVPFLLASAYLVWIARRLRKGDVRALTVARQWVFAAFGTIALSLLIQVIATVPATMEYQRHLLETFPVMPSGAGAPPFDVKQMTSSMTVVGMILGVVLGTVFMSVWPVVLWVWSGKLMRESAQSSADR